MGSLEITRKKCLFAFKYFLTQHMGKSEKKHRRMASSKNGKTFGKTKRTATGLFSAFFRLVAVLPLSLATVPELSENASSPPARLHPHILYVGHHYVRAAYKILKFMYLKQKWFSRAHRCFNGTKVSVFIFLKLKTKFFSFGEYIFA